MQADYSGGLDEGREYFLSTTPQNPDLRESASLWVSDDQGAIGLPRMGIEKIGSMWDMPGFQVNIGFPDGRAVVVRDAGVGKTPVDSDGTCRRMSAGALEFRCVEPFSTWEVTYQGPALDTSAHDLAHGLSDGAPRCDIMLRTEFTMAAPPWVPGTLVQEAGAMMASGIEGVMISDRYEQLVRTSVELRIGTAEYAFNGTGLRIRRQGVRNVEGFWGHCWQSALFPSGRGFGFLTFPPRPDGVPSFNEGYLFDGTDLIPATVVEAPWLTSLTPIGEDASCTLRTADGDVRIEGENILSTYVAPGANVEFAPALHQAGCRYTWDGEVTYGMIERSAPADTLRG
jgi:hypothetical protein